MTGPENLFSSGVAKPGRPYDCRYAICKSQLYVFKTVTGVPPNFTTDGQPPEAVVVDLQADGNNLVLPCGVTGAPTPSVSWFREGSLIDPTSVMADGTLSINVNETEAPREGTSFYCVATNRIGPGNSIVAALRSRDINVSHSCE